MKKLMKLTSSLVACGLLAGCSGEKMIAPPAQVETPFFAMDTAIRDAQHTTRESQMDMVADLGYAGITLGLGSVDDLSDTLQLLDARGLELFGVYLGLNIDDEIPARLLEALPPLKGRGVCIWAAMNSSTCGNSSPAGDDLAVPLLRELADAAAPYGVSVVLYTHANMWLERVEDAVRVARKVDRSSVGVTFNLCHWIKVSPDQDLVSIIRKASPHLKMVSINGADRGGTDWKQLIQPLDRGTYDVGRVLEVLREVGYAGPIGFQGFGIGGDARDNLSRTMAAWRALHAPKPVWHDELLGRELVNEIETYAAGGSRKAFTILEARLRDAPPDGRVIIENRLLDLLDSGRMTPDARCAVIRLLGRWGTATRTISMLGSLLDSSETYQAALEALRSLSSEEAGEALRMALSRLEGDASVGVINVVGELRDGKALETLATLVGSEDAAVARAAIAALGTIGSEKATVRLASFQTSETAAQAHALLRCANRLMADGARARAQAVFVDVFANGESIPLRVAALNGLAHSGDATTVIDALGSEEPAICRAAAGLLVSLQGTNVAKLAAEQLRSLPNDAQTILLAGLAQRGDRAAADAVAVATTRGSEAVRIAAVRALGRLGDVTHVDLLVRAMSTEGDLGTVAREALLALNAPGVGDAIAGRLADGRADDRCALIAIAADRRMHGVVPVLIRFVRDGASDERSAALGALRILATGDHLPNLVALMRVPMEDADLSRLTKVLRTVIARNGVTNRHVDQLVSVLNAVDETAKPAVLEVLGHTGTDAAFDAVSECVTSPAIEVRKTAVRTLAGWPDEKPLPVLREIASKEVDLSTAVLAFRGYVDMLVRSLDLRDETTPVTLQEAAAIARRPEDKQYALAKIENLQNAMKEIDGCICSWELAGPYTAAGKSLFAAAFPPEQDDGSEGDWRRIDALAGPFTKFLRPGDVNLGAIMGGDNRVAYLRTEISSDSERDAVLDLGCDDGMKVWLNGEVVLAKDVKGAHRRGMESVPVRLKQGHNLLMLKVTQASGEWGASARLREVEQ